MKNDVLEQFYKKYYNQLKIYIFSLCGDMAAAEDIVCDTFYKAMRLKNEEGKDVKYWLIKVARNLCYDYLRKRKRLRPMDERMVAENESQIDRLILEEEYAAIYKALAYLPEREREAVTLFYFQDFSVREVAELMHLNEGNIKVILFRARQELKARLEAML